jgi:hypothetical protein
VPTPDRVQCNGAGVKSQTPAPFDKDHIVIEWGVPWHSGCRDGLQSDQAQANDTPQEE